MNGYVKMSRYAGMREDLVQAGGGNSSFKKSPDMMLIKASGIQLAEISEESGYAIVNPMIIKEAFMTVNNLDSITEETGKEILNNSFIDGKRPSIETFIHAVSGKYTLHTHPIVVNALACRENWERELSELFPDAMLVPYATPGVELAKAYFRVYREEGGSKDGEIVFLQNHGLLVAGNNEEEVICKTENVLRIIEDYIGTRKFDSYHNLTKIWMRFSTKILWRVTDENVLRLYNIKGLWEYAFCPDCVVFLGKKVFKMKPDTTEEEINTFLKINANIILIEYLNNLYICTDSVKKALEIQSVLSFSAQVMEINNGQKCRLLTEGEQDFLIDWDAEKYRMNLK